jgi:hypothetical protein
MELTRISLFFMALTYCISTKEVLTLQHNPIYSFLKRTRDPIEIVPIVREAMMNDEGAWDWIIQAHHYSRHNIEIDHRLSNRTRLILKNLIEHRSEHLQSRHPFVLTLYCATLRIQYSSVS